MMIKRDNWKYVTCPVDPDQLFDLVNDPLELKNLATKCDEEAEGGICLDKSPITRTVLADFRKEAKEKWDMDAITKAAKKSQRQRRLVWNALKQGKWTSWDYNPAEHDDGREKYIRSHMPLDDLELRARYPAVDDYGVERGGMSLMSGVVVSTR